jgi:hypothetical protein
VIVIATVTVSHSVFESEFVSAEFARDILLLVCILHLYEILMNYKEKDEQNNIRQYVVLRTMYCIILIQGCPNGSLQIPNIQQLLLCSQLFTCGCSMFGCLSQF